MVFNPAFLCLKGVCAREFVQAGITDFPLTEPTLLFRVIFIIYLFNSFFLSFLDFIHFISLFRESVRVGTGAEGEREP